MSYAFHRWKFTNTLLTTPLGQLSLEIDRTQPNLSGISTSMPDSGGR